MARKLTVKTHRPEPSERIKGETVPPTMTLKLMETIGVSRTSRMLGVSTTTLHKARKFGLVSRVIEVAAEGALHNLAPPAATAATTMPRRSTVMFMIEVEQGQADMVRKFADMLGAKLLAA